MRGHGRQNKVLMYFQHAGHEMTQMENALQSGAISYLTDMLKYGLDKDDVSTLMTCITYSNILFFSPTSPLHLRSPS